MGSEPLFLVYGSAEAWPSPSNFFNLPAPDARVSSTISLITFSHILLMGNECELNQKFHFFFKSHPDFSHFARAFPYPLLTFQKDSWYLCAVLLSSQF
jgi:hypothetical protein